MEDENDTFETLPNALIDELKSAEKSVPLITARVDRQLADLATDQFKNRPQPKWTQRPAWAAVAASVLIAVLVAQFSSFDSSGPGETFADHDGSGQIDIADVLLLARTRNPEQVTQAEIDAFAMRIVSLSSGGDAS